MCWWWGWCFWVVGFLVEMLQFHMIRMLSLSMAKERSLFLDPFTTQEVHLRYVFCFLAFCLSISSVWRSWANGYLWALWFGLFGLQMWPDLLEKAKEGGLDVIQTYVFWNGHEPQPGKVSKVSSFLWSVSCSSITDFLLGKFSVLFWGQVWCCEVY